MINTECDYYFIHLSLFSTQLFCSMVSLVLYMCLRIQNNNLFFLLSITFSHQLTGLLLLENVSFNPLCIKQAKYHVGAFQLDLLKIQLHYLHLISLGHPILSSHKIMLPKQTIHSLIYGECFQYLWLELITNYF